jgi:aldehyde dehydrogenase
LACSEGAKLITGPTIFTGNNKMRIFQEKIFGPGRGGHVVRRLRRRRRDHAAFEGPKQSGIAGETHKMMLDHYRQTKTC